MLLRKIQKKVRVIMWITLILIIPAFVIWGIGASDSTRKNLIAKVNNRPITMQNFSTTYNMLYNQFTVLLKNLNQDEFQKKIQELNLEERTFELLVENIIINEAIKKRRIKVSDDEVAEQIRKLAFFTNREGNFDKEEFERKMKNLTASQRLAWEEGIRNHLAFEKLKKEIESHYKNDADKDNEKKGTAYGNWLAKKRTEVKIKQKNLPRFSK